MTGPSSKLTAENTEIAEKEFRFVNSAGSASSAVKIKELRHGKEESREGSMVKGRHQYSGKIIPEARHC